MLFECLSNRLGFCGRGPDGLLMRSDIGSAEDVLCAFASLRSWQRLMAVLAFLAIKRFALIQ